jgi:hypothetical protein
MSTDTDTDEEETIAVEDSDDNFTWVEAVERAKSLHLYLEQSQLKLGKLASKIDTKYGEASLNLFAKETEIPFETLKRYRSVWRRWEKEGRIPQRYSVARALATIQTKITSSNDS